LSEWQREWGWHGAPPRVQPLRMVGLALPEEVHRGRREPVHPIQERAFRFLLERGPLSQRVPTGNPDDPASALLDIDPRSARPEIELWTYRPKSAQPGEPLKPPAPDERGQSWRPRRHLLESREEEAHFAVEVDDQGRAQLRFGREGLGREPEIGTDVVVRYRIGIGVAGNVGAGALAHVFLLDGLIDIEKVRNPLPAWGGVDPEPIERVRLLAPAAYRADQPRAVTPADYERVVELHPQVSRAAATLRWTGSWYTVFLTIDRQGGARIDAAFEAELTAHLERYRMTGYDLEIQPPVLVPLEIEADVCVAATHFRSDVERAVLERLFGGGSGRGARAFFDPDELTLGQSVWLSRLLAAICEVPGVSSATVPVFHRYGRVAASEQENGVIPIARLEIAQLENDVNAPENGCLRLNLMGGK
ncbi:MAG: putative baseplate assembly protein, partial [Planctomycetota bacterium]